MDDVFASDCSDYSGYCWGHRSCHHVPCGNCHSSVGYPSRYSHCWGHCTHPGYRGHCNCHVGDHFHDLCCHWTVIKVVVVVIMVVMVTEFKVVLIVVSLVLVVPVVVDVVAVMVIVVVFVVIMAAIMVVVDMVVTIKNIMVVVIALVVLVVTCIFTVVVIKPYSNNFGVLVWQWLRRNVHTWMFDSSIHEGQKRSW